MTTTYKYYKAIHPDDALYWDKQCAKKLLSFTHCDTAVAQSTRNYGKSYTGMTICTDDALSHGESCAWGRYNGNELKQAINTWLDFNPELTVMKGRSNSQSSTWLIDPVDEGRILLYAWNISQNLKGIDHAFKWNVCDEFIPERYTNKTRLDTEFKDWTSVYKSIKRSYSMRTLMLSNNIYWMNPFFLGWCIEPFSKGQIQVSHTELKIEIDGTKFKTSRDIAFENIQATKAIIERNLKQQALEFSTDAELKAYFENETKKEYASFGKCPDLDIPLSRYVYMTMDYFFAYRYYKGKFYYCKVAPDITKDTLVGEPEYVDANANRRRDTQIPKLHEERFNNGLCVFDRPETLTAFFRWVRACRTRIS